MRNGVQLYKCNACGKQYRVSKKPSPSTLWGNYQEKKQTLFELSETYHISVSSVQRRLKTISKEWTQPVIDGSGFVHIDATYWGHNWGLLLALDSASGKPLYLKFIKHETLQDYRDAIASIQSRGYEIRGIITDGHLSLFKEYQEIHFQMCHFHMREIVKRYLTKKPKLIASRELKEMMSTLTSSSEHDFIMRFNAWEMKWHDALERRTQLKSGRSQYTHRRLRSAVNSLKRFLPYLFTYQHEGFEGMPNTNNKIEGKFTDLKCNLNSHRGMSIENRKRFICGFFLA